MCGIIGYIGNNDAISFLIEGLRKLEYRGYDSCGVVVGDEKGNTKLYKTKGKIAKLEELLLENGENIRGNIGLGHTRWATHGKPSEKNAHPHFDCQKKIFIVHNGIIENFNYLKRDLEKKGHRFNSDTDTEVIAHLIEEFYEGDLLTAVLESLKFVTGTFGLGIIHRDEPDKIIFARRGSPLILGIGKNEMVASSDVAAILKLTDRVIYMEDNQVAVLKKNDYKIYSLTRERVRKKPEKVEWKLTDTDKNGYPHYMLKEIYEQPETILNATRGRILKEEGTIKLGGLESVIDKLKKMKRLIIVSCGTSYHAGLIARYIFEKLTDINVEVEYASEFRYRNINITENTVVLAISQSGETADTIAAIKEAKRKGALTIGLVNVVGSTIARLTTAGVYNHAGPEIGVASTKLFTSQVVILLMIATLLGRFKKLSMNDGLNIINALEKLPSQIEEILKESDKIREIAKKYHKYPSFLYIGRLFNYPTALEGALKLKEVSYIHAEGYPAGEMKHGPIALISPDCPVMAICPKDSMYEKMIGNIKEIEARNGKIIIVTTEKKGVLKEIGDEIIKIPETIEMLYPILSIIPLQLFAYYCALYNGCEIDKPRNLAKSVTVE